MLYFYVKSVISSFNYFHQGGPEEPPTGAVDDLFEPLSPDESDFFDAVNGDGGLDEVSTIITIYMLCKSQTEQIGQNDAITFFL